MADRYVPVRCVSEGNADIGDGIILAPGDSGVADTQNGTYHFSLDNGHVEIITDPNDPEAVAAAQRNADYEAERLAY